MKPDKTAVDKQVAEFIATCYSDPLRYVMGCFPWGTDPSIQLVKLNPEYRERFNCLYGPDVWACEFLDQLGEEIRKRNFDGIHAVDPIQFATCSGHGVGKSSMVAWLVKFILDTRPFSRGIVTAGTAEQLKTKTWAEVGKWHRLSLTRNWFNYTSGRGSMVLVHREFKEQWRCDALTCREENHDSFQGLHAANSTPFMIFDEASAIPDAIFSAREGATTDGEPMVFDFGNLVRNSGRFFEHCEGWLKHRFIVRRIDSRSVQIANKKRINQWIEDYGIDSDFVKIKVLGQAPKIGLNQFLSTESVRKSMERELVEDRNAPLVLGVDVARKGDNATVIFPRKGRDARSFPARVFYELDSVQVAARVAQTVGEFRQLGLIVAAIFIDGGGVGGPVCDQLKHLGYNVIEVLFGGNAMDPVRYKPRISEMYGNLRDALNEGLCLPPFGDEIGEKLFTQLTQRTFTYTAKGQIMIASKDDDDDITSYDESDALVLTFAEKLGPMHYPQQTAYQPAKVITEYDPMEVAW